jgi:hypothetical protein
MLFSAFSVLHSKFIIILFTDLYDYAFSPNVAISRPREERHKTLRHDKTYTGAQEPERGTAAAGRLD